MSGQLHRQPAVYRHGEQAGLLVDNLPELSACGERVEGLANIFSEDRNDGRSCMIIHNISESCFRGKLLFLSGAISRSPDDEIS